MRFVPLRPMGMKLGTVVGGNYFRRSSGVKGQVKFQVAQIEFKFRRVMLDREGVQNAYQGGCPLKSNWVKGQIKVKVAWCERKLGEGNARPRTSAKCVSRRTPSKVK